jgi:hypothetical protein
VDGGLALTTRFPSYRQQFGDSGYGIGQLLGFAIPVYVLVPDRALQQEFVCALRADAISPGASVKAFAMMSALNWGQEYSGCEATVAAEVGAVQCRDCCKVSAYARCL